MKAPVTVDDFLEIEEEGRRLARLRAPAREVRRFHAAARRFATAWVTGPDRRISAVPGKVSVSLNFELQDRYGWVPVFGLRADHGNGEFCLHGPNPDRRKAKVSVKVRKAMDDLHKGWKALPGAEPQGDLAVLVHLPRLADSGFDRFLEAAVQHFADI